MKNSVILLAGGDSARMNSSTPKQYMKINNKSILEICLNNFLNHSEIDNIVIVINKNHLSYIKNILDHAVLSKIVEIVEGGETRAISTINGLNFIKKYNPINVLIHDIARPFCSSHMIGEILQKLENNIAVIPIIKPTDTVKQLNEQEIIKTLNRDNLCYVQTPQGYKYKTILELHLNNSDKKITDDSFLYEKAGLPIFTIKGEKNNQKITYMEDIQNLNITNNITKIGQGFDVHAFTAPKLSSNNYIMLGGVKILHPQSLEAYSDGDVVLHALCDALLGSFGGGDIGEHFPPSEAKWKDASSATFVQHIMKLLKAKSGKVINVDITILAESPKIFSYKPEMKKTIAKLLEIQSSQVNIKATTTEKLGFIGRKEGLASSAILLAEFIPN